jgi:hypothetical protein
MDSQYVIDFDAGSGAFSHSSVERLIRILHHGDSTVALHRHQPDSPIVEGTGKQHADHPAPKALGSRAKQRVDRGPVAILPRPASELNPVLGDEHMAVRWRDVNPAGLYFLIVGGVDGWEGARTAENSREHTLAVRGKVMDDEDGSRQIAGEAGSEPSHGLDASGGESNYNYIMTRHAGGLPGTYIKDCTVGPL